MPEQNSRKIDLFILAGFAYLILPFFFFLAYLEPLLLSLLVPMTWIGIILSRSDNKVYKLDKISITQRWLIIFSILVFVLLGGFPQLIGFEQLFDWQKHNTILSDLIKTSWPVVYPDGSFLNYYLGIYLVPAFVGKLMGGFTIGKIFLSIWILIGLIVSVQLIYNYLFKVMKDSRFVIFGLILLLLLSGVDWLQYYINNGYLPRTAEHIEWSYRIYFDGVYRGFFQYSSMVTLITHVPQHLYPAVIGICLTLLTKRYYILLIPVLLIWSPFSAIGVGLAMLLIKRKDILKFEYLFYSFLLTVPVAVFFLHHNRIDGGLFVTTSISRYLIFLAFELLPIMTLTILSWSNLKKTEKIVQFSCLMLLCVFPLFRYGSMTINDVFVRSAFPLFLLATIIPLAYINKYSLVKIAIVIIVWSLGLATPIFEFLRIQPGRGYQEPMDSILEIRGGKAVHDQYLGRPWR